MWILWLHASSAARFDQDIQTFADDVKIPGREEKDANIYQLVRAWLLDNRRTWLIVLDNADDAEFLFEASESGRFGTRTRIEYMPVCSHGSILITTRWLETARRLTDNTNIIDLQADKDHAIRFLKTKMGRTEHNEDMERLATTLDYMPLAIMQEVAYILKRTPRCTVGDYLIKLEKSERSKTKLLSDSSKELRRDMQAKDSILLTWQISFEHIRGMRPSAADLLSLMSFFDNQGIPDFLLNISSNKGQSWQDTEYHEADDSSAEDDSNAAFEEDVTTLRDYFFVFITSDSSVLQMHRLVQLAALEWLRKQEQYTQWELKKSSKAG